MCDYTLGKIYRVCDKKRKMIYFGSTCKKSLDERFEQHKFNYLTWKQNGKRYYTLFEIFDDYGVDNCIIELIEDYPCNSLQELVAKEDLYIQSLNCVNRKGKFKFKKNLEKKNKHLKKTDDNSNVILVSDIEQFFKIGMAINKK